MPLIDSGGPYQPPNLGAPFGGRGIGPLKALYVFWSDFAPVDYHLMGPNMRC